MRTSRRIVSGLLAAVLAAGVSSSFAGGEREQKVAMKDCPDAVLRAIRKQAGKGRVLEIEKETGKCGRVVYEAVIKRIDGVTIEVEVAPCGELLGVEVEADDDRG